MGPKSNDVVHIRMPCEDTEMHRGERRPWSKEWSDVSAGQETPRIPEPPEARKWLGGIFPRAFRGNMALQTS